MAWPSWQGLFPWPELAVFQLSCLLSKCQQPSFSPLATQHTSYTLVQTWMLLGCWKANTAPHAFVASTVAHCTFSHPCCFTYSTTISSLWPLTLPLGACVLYYVFIWVCALVYLWVYMYTCMWMIEIDPGCYTCMWMIELNPGVKEVCCCTHLFFFNVWLLEINTQVLMVAQ